MKKWAFVFVIVVFGVLILSGICPAGKEVWPAYFNGMTAWTKSGSISYSASGTHANSYPLLTAKKENNTIKTANYEVHEWGVLVGCSESNEAIVTSRPKYVDMVKQPVIYIHSKNVKQFDASFTFLKGAPTDSYPKATVKGKAVLWKNIKVLPQEKTVTKGFVPLPEVIPNLRTEDADNLDVNGVKERFLFYEGEMSFENKIEIVQRNLDRKEVTVKNNSGYDVYNLFYATMEGDFIHPSYISGRIDRLNSGEKKTIKLDETDKLQLLTDDLKNLGFTESEARSFTSLWGVTFFKPNNVGFTQLIYRLPQKEYDKLIKSKYSPAPKKEIRALYVLYDLTKSVSSR